MMPVYFYYYYYIFHVVFVFVFRWRARARAFSPPPCASDYFIIAITPLRLLCHADLFTFTAKKICRRCSAPRRAMRAAAFTRTRAPARATAIKIFPSFSHYLFAIITLMRFFRRAFRHYAPARCFLLLFSRHDMQRHGAIRFSFSPLTILLIYYAADVSFSFH